MAEENKAIARRWMEELWSQGNASVADALIAPNYVVHDPGTPRRSGGVEGEKHTVAMYRTVFPDLRFTMEEVIGEGDRVVVRWTDLREGTCDETSFGGCAYRGAVLFLAQAQPQGQAVQSAALLIGMQGAVSASPKRR